jgi:hypothetical protein
MKKAPDREAEGFCFSDDPPRGKRGTTGPDDEGGNRDELS